MDSNNSTSLRIYKYDLFLSFRGTETRNTFTDHLYHHLIRKGIFVFKDDQSLQKGESISPQLLQAIQNSRVSIIVFSKDYAASSWCLDEMATIIGCHKIFRQTVFPVFYDVDPSHVRKQIGVFGDAFFLHASKIKHDLEKVDRWQIAMTELGNLVGFDVRDEKAFKKEDEIHTYVELIPEVLRYAQHLPLAIRVVGSSLCTRDAIQWRDALDGLRNNPDDDIMDVLQMSVDGLQHNEKEIFLHIACFFKGEREEYVKRILDACELHPLIGIQRIVEKSLITIRNQEIHMHEMLQDLGKKIIRHQFPEDPGSWSRLWRYKDFYHVLTTETNLFPKLVGAGYAICVNSNM